MPPVYIILLVLFAFAIGAVIVWLVMRGKLNVARTILDERTAEGVQFQQTISELEKTVAELNEARQQLAIRAEVLTTQLDNEQQNSREALENREQAARIALEAQERRHAEAIAAQQARFDETIERVTAQMKDATNEMLRQRQKEFTEASGTSIGGIVNPLKENIEELKRTLAENKNQQSEDSGAIKTIIEQMMKSSEEARRSTDELTRVFRKSNNVQGLWGETVLDELLESQGLTRGIHYDVQPTIRDAAGNVVYNDDGSYMRPDIILHLDQQREVVIDSKVSLAAYMDYVNAQTDAERNQALAQHIASIREQVKNLSKKDYSSYIQPPKVRMDYVIMFVPNTGALWTALGAQPTLWRWAMDQNVYIADEQTLFAALRIISLTWMQIRQAENHQKVFALAEEMMNRVGQFMDKYKVIGSSLAKAQEAYKEGERKLQPSGQSILQTCSKLQKLGAKQSAKNPLPEIDEK